jgi:hypothetical protein
MYGNVRSQLTHKTHSFSLGRLRVLDVVSIHKTLILILDFDVIQTGKSDTEPSSMHSVRSIYSTVIRFLASLHPPFIGVTLHRIHVRLAQVHHIPIL